MTTPVQVGLTALPVLVGALGCFDRIETYLNQPPSGASKRRPQSQACRSWEKGRDFTLDEVCIELEGKQILHNFTYCFPAGSISLIVGPSGAGKTTILNAMLAELPVKSGLISTPPSSVAYCSQEPWVRNSSMRDAICGEALWDQDWYNEVIQACFPDGAPEMPGDGTQMSEGQRKKLVSQSRRKTLDCANHRYDLLQECRSNILRRFLHAQCILVRPWSLWTTALMGWTMAPSWPYHHVFLDEMAC